MNLEQLAATGGAQTTELSDSEASGLKALLQKEFRPQTERAKEQVESAVQTLARHALEGVGLTSDDAVESIESIIAAIDQKLSAQINEILHHEEFQKVESAWRGLSHLVSRTETSPMLKVRVLNVSKKELGKTLRSYKGVKWDQSPIFKKIYEEEYGQFGGAPYGCLVADYTFDHQAADVEMLSELGKIAAAAHAPVITSPAPSLFRLDSWRELGNPKDLAMIFTTPEYAAWRSLRESDDSRYIGLAMPRFLARQPYGPKSNPVEAFAFEEDTRGDGNFSWGNAAYAMAANITRSFAEYGWCSRIRGIESGGAVDGLPTHVFPTDDGGTDMTCPTEIAISDRREKELANAGFMPLVHRKNTDMAAFIGAQSLHKPAQYDDEDATKNAQLAARLPYLFATCRFAHYLKCIVRDKIGSFKSADETQRWLQSWLTQYIEGNLTHASEEKKAKKPLAEAKVTIAEDPENPGYYHSTFLLRPHYQLEGMNVSLRLVAKLPSK